MKTVPLSVGRSISRSVPKESMTYAFTHMGNFFLLFLVGLGLLAGVLDLEAEIWASWDLALQARILALRLGFGS